MAGGAGWEESAHGLIVRFCWELLRKVTRKISTWNQRVRGIVGLEGVDRP